MASALGIAGPAAAMAAAVTYLNAKSGFSYDMGLFNSIGPTVYQLAVRQRTDRLNYFYILERHAKAKQTANRPMLKFQDRIWTFAQVYATVLRYGSWLRTRLGIKPKDMVAVDAMNSDMFVFIWLGLWAIGAKPAFINYNLTGAPLAHCVKAAGARVMLVDPEVADMVTDEVRSDIGPVQVVVMTRDVEAEIAAAQETRYPDSDRSEDFYYNTSALIFTSGTTGLPKPAIISYSKAILAGNHSSRWLGLRDDDVFYTPMPLYHSSAGLLGFLACLERGVTFATGRKFSARQFWKEVRAHDATVIQYVGETCRYLVAAPPEVDEVTGEQLDRKHRVRLAYGNGLRPDVWAKFKERFGIDTISEFYAATEAPLAMCNHSRNDFAFGAVGRFGWLGAFIFGLLVRNVEVDYDTEEPWRDPKTGFCRQAKKGKPGEVLFRLSSSHPERTFRGYYNNEKATNSKLLRNVFKQGDVWFRSGDTVVWDSEGRIFFTDRLGDTYRWKSENVSTAEVSQMVGLHPAVLEANVYGVELPHHDGRAGCAAVALTGEPDESTMQSIAGHVNRTLPAYARPLFLRVMDQAGEKVNGTVKQVKHGLRDEGVCPDKLPPSTRIFWLRENAYKPFSRQDWRRLSRGECKL